MEGREITELFANNEFLEFVLRGAEGMLAHATGEDLAVFGFGSVEAAVEAFEEAQDGKGHD
jgi:hypothetical protein